MKGTTRRLFHLISGMEMGMKMMSGDECEFSVSRWENDRGPVGEKNDDELQLETTMAMLSACL